MAKQKTPRQSMVEMAVLAPLDWIDERTGAVRGTKWFLFRNVPRDISWAQTLGFASLIAFGAQALTGAILAMYYEPSSDIDPITGKPIAYSSIEHITNEVTLGWLVRGMHRWGASVFIILLFLHMGRVFLFGAYKYPRELNWIIGVLILVMRDAHGLHGLPAAVGPDRVLGDGRGDQPERHRALRWGRGSPGSSRAVPRSAPTRCRSGTRCTCCSSRAR